MILKPQSQKGGQAMDSIEKARLRLQHWISHSDHHHEEYQKFVKELEQGGQMESARHIKEMIGLNSRSAECLKKALKALRN
jgi:hypothetical protein